jgi:hypothetical protein
MNPWQKPSLRRKTVVEPYAWVDIDSQLRSKQTSLRDIPLYTKQEWQGLTLEDIDDIGVSKDWVCGARWAEAKLREKNT